MGQRGDLPKGTDMDVKSAETETFAVAVNSRRAVPGARTRQPGPREQILEDGPAGLTDAALLALFLGTGLPGEPVIQLATRILEVAGGLRGLLSADRETLLAMEGLGHARVALLKAALELGQRYLRQSLEHDGWMDGPEDHIACRVLHSPVQ